MKTLKTITTATIACAVLSVASVSSYAMDEHIEAALIDVCKSTLTNSVAKFTKTTKSFNLNDKTVALKVMCNGDDIISFAENHGAYKTAARLESSIGNTNIIDVAAINKINVNF